jgi:hypothetical protein
MGISIWKFILETTDLQVIEMPRGAEILAFQMQGASPCIWAKCEINAPKETRRFIFVGTGHPFPEQCGPHVGTVQIGGLVLHLFEART